MIIANNMAEVIKKQKVSSVPAEKSAAPPLIGEFLAWLFGLIVSVFFREIRTRGSHKIPLTGPVIFVVAPHANQFLDPVMVLRSVPRSVGFLCAQKTMERKYVGKMARALNAIPVSRAQDLARKGSGRIQLSDRYGEPTRITGTGTRFTSQLQVGWTVALPQNRGSAVVAEIISDTELCVTKEFKELSALESLTAPNGTLYKVIPHVDQSEVYRMVHERLTSGGCIGIFPEGGSHDRAEMLPLKAGVTVMALGAMAAHPGLDVKIVPVGLNYFHPDRFRSRAVVEFGNAITVDSSLVERFKEGGERKREACAKLLDTIYTSLKSVTINCPDYETLMVVQAARRLYQPPVKRRLRDTARVLRLQRRLVEGYLKVKDHPAVIDVRDRVLEYNTLLSYYGLRDHQVRNTTLDFTRAFQLWSWRLITLILMAFVALPGLIINLPCILLASLISKRKAKEALAASTVKIKGRDVLATWKVLVALGFVPISYLIYASIIFVQAIRWNWPLKWEIGAPLLAFSAFPIISYLSILFGERGADIYKSLRPLTLALVPFGRKQLRQLPIIREELSRDITALVNELGPQVFPEFDVERAFDSVSPQYSRNARYRGHRGRNSEDYDESSETGGASSEAISGAATPGLISLRGWIRSPIELLDSTNFDWGSMDDKEDQEDDVFFFGSRANSTAVTPNLLSRNSSMSAAIGIPSHAMVSISTKCHHGDTLIVPDATSANAQCHMESEVKPVASSINLTNSTESNKAVNDKHERSNSIDSNP
jgi:glycerol-3-phosphate O-acyltransferase/dihydroxyacetone phosphate acyltransferase